MKITATSDLHYPFLDYHELFKSKSDLIVIAGDISSYSHVFEEAIKTFRTSTPIVAVLGNHDLYTEGEDSFLVAEKLKFECKKYNIHLLDDKPFIFHDTAFVGNIGWYDYSFADINSEQIIGVDNVKGIKFKKACEITEEDFAQKSFYHGNQSKTWMDKKFIHTNLKDKQILDIQLNKLERDLMFAEKNADKIVYVSHHVPISDFIYSRDLLWNVFNAYQGSAKLGDTALKNNKVKCIISGHSHIPNKRTKFTPCYDVSSEKVIPQEIIV